MAKRTDFFLGANSGMGFQSLYSHLIDLEDTHDLMVLKGGPGVGKATFMKQIAQSMEEADVPVEYIWCSGDPDSLDAVLFPTLRVAIVDGTSPHIIEPQYPAAVDRYINLGRFYDIDAAKSIKAIIMAHTKAYKRDYVRAFRCLRAARQVEQESAEIVQSVMDWKKADRRMNNIMQRELRHRGDEKGKTTLRFLGSITYKGQICRFDTVDTLANRVYALMDDYELSGRYLEWIRAAAVDKGWDVIACPSTEDQSRLEHLIIPGLGLAFVTSSEKTPYPGKPARRIRLNVMAEPVNRGRLRFEKRMVRSLREEAVASLKEAKENHDRLEADYNPYVDFDGVHSLADVEIARLGRLL